MRRRIKNCVLAAISSLILGAGGSAYAQLFGGIVYDPTNYAQNLLTATRTLTMINNQVKQLTNEAQMLVNEAKELTSLPYSARIALNQRLIEIETLIKTAKSLAYDVASIDASFLALYPEDYTAYSNAAMASDARIHWEQASRAFHDAMIMQAKIAETISADMASLDEIIIESENAVGNLQAEQAGNQLLALQIKQAMQAAELFAVASRADALDRARQLQTEERARIANARFIGDGIMYP